MKKYFKHVKTFCNKIKMHFILDIKKRLTICKKNKINKKHFKKGHSDMRNQQGLPFFYHPKIS